MRDGIKRDNGQGNGRRDRCKMESNEKSKMRRTVREEVRRKV